MFAQGMGGLYMSVESKQSDARCINASMKPLPEGYPYDTQTCCEDFNCPKCHGKPMYIYKRIKGQRLPDEMHDTSGDLGDKPDW